MKYHIFMNVKKVPRDVIKRLLNLYRYINICSFAEWFCILKDTQYHHLCICHSTNLIPYKYHVYKPLDKSKDKQSQNSILPPKLKDKNERWLVTSNTRMVPRSMCVTWLSRLTQKVWQIDGWWSSDHPYVSVCFWKWHKNYIQNVRFKAVFQENSKKNTYLDVI